MNDFLPQGYEAPVIEGDYMKLKKGKNHFRVMGSAVVGWEYWTKENKPVRSVTEFEEMPNAKTDDAGKIQPPKFFWAFPVYNYSAKKIQILEITQITIREALEALLTDEAWGSPQGYDIVITGTGDKMQREYTVMPKPHTKQPSVQMPTINLDGLFSGADPFASSSTQEFNKDIELEPVGDMDFGEVSQEG